MNPWQMLGINLDEYGRYPFQQVNSPMSDVQMQQYGIIPPSNSGQNNDQPPSPIPIPEQSGASEMSPMNAYLASQLAGNSISPEQQKLLSENIGQQKSALEELRTYQRGLNDKPVQLDLSPLAALSDSLTGSKLQAGYSKPTSGEDRIGALAKLQGMSQNQRNQITQDLLKLSGGQNNQRVLSTLIRNEQSMRAAAGKIIPAVTNDSVVKTTQLQENALDKALGRIRDVKAGKLPFSSTLKSEIESDLAQALSGSTVNALGKQERIEFNPLSAKWENFKGQLLGEQQDIRAPGYLDQLEAGLMGLGGDINTIRTKRANELLGSYSIAHEGNPYAQKTIKSLQGQYKPAQVVAPRASEVSTKTKYVPGYEEGGYIFNGGDPQNPANWKTK